MSSVMSLPQKRSRQRRTYQFERTSAKSCMARELSVISYPREVLVHQLYKAVESGEYPPVHQRQSAFFERILRRVVFVYLGIEREERIGVPQRAEVFALRLRYRLFIEARGQPGCGRGIEVPAHSVGALLVEHRPGVDDVAACVWTSLCRSCR